MQCVALHLHPSVMRQAWVAACLFKLIIYIALILNKVLPTANRYISSRIGYKSHLKWTTLRRALWDSVERVIRQEAWFPNDRCVRGVALPFNALDVNYKLSSADKTWCIKLRVLLLTEHEEIGPGFYHTVSMSLNLPWIAEVILCASRVH